VALTSLQSQSATLEEAVASAIDNSPDLQQQYARYQSSISLQKSARGDYLPQVRLTAGYGREETNYSSGQKIDEELDRQEVGIIISQLIFDGFRAQSEVGRLGEEATSERYTLISRAENTALVVCEIYLGLLKTGETLRLAKRNVQDHVEALEDIRQRVSKGLSSPSDLAQVSARLSSARASMIAADNNYFDLRAQYIRQVGTEPKDLIDPIDDALLIPESLAASLKNARDNHPELMVARADMAAAQAERRASQYRFYPKFSLELAASDNKNLGGFEGPDEDARLMLKMEYDLYNGGRDKYRAQASGWRYNEAMAIYKRTYLEIEEGTRLAWNAKRFLGQQVLIYQDNVDASTAAHAGYIQQFRIGRRTLLDVLDSKVELFLARKNYINAKYGYKLANYRLNNKAGTLIYSMRVDYPNQWSAEEPEWAGDIVEGSVQ
jgi:adhesin transport system outer membrane protein